MARTRNGDIDKVLSLATHLYDDEIDLSGAWTWASVAGHNALAEADLVDEDEAYLVLCVLAWIDLHDPLVGRVLYNLASGLAEAYCRADDCGLCFCVRGLGPEVTWVTCKTDREVPENDAILLGVPADAREAAERWARRLAPLIALARMRHPEVASALDSLCGGMRCPHCDAPLAIGDAITRAYVAIWSDATA
jgi:hypothetical protein